MARGQDVYKRCGCRDAHGRLLKSCPRLRRADHGTWSFRIRLADGRRHRRSGFATRQAAEQARRELLERLEVGGTVAPTETTEAYLRAWMSAKERRLRPTTVLGYKNALERHVLPALGHHTLERLRFEHVQQFVDDMEERGSTPQTVSKTLAVLRSALNDAVRQRRLTHNPAQYARSARPRRKPVQPWEPDELGTFLDHAAHDRLGPLFEVIAMTGLRRGEACGLRWCDFDPERSRLTVTQQLTEAGGYLRLAPPKTASGEHRRLDLDDGTVATLLAHRLRQDAERALLGSAWGIGTDELLAARDEAPCRRPGCTHGLIFTREDGRPLRPEMASARFRALVASAGLRPVRLHDLRHGSASLQLAAGVPMAVVSKRLGHSTTAFTADTYSHLLEGVGHAAAAAAAALVPRSGRSAGDTVGPTLDPQAILNDETPDTAVRVSAGQGPYEGGAACRNRTDDLFITSESLCRLS